MTLHVQPATPGVKGVDTVSRITHAQALALYGAGYRFAVRYLGHISSAEVIDITSAKMALLFVAGYSRKPGWTPTAAMGLQDGTQAIAHAQELGAIGTSIYVDLEGTDCPKGIAHEKIDCLLYGNTVAHVIKQGKSPAGVYVGWGLPFTPFELYWAFAFTGYWKSCSQVPDVAVRGYQMIQHSPPNQRVCGVTVDINTIQADHKGSVPQWLIAS